MIKRFVGPKVAGERARVPPEDPCVCVGTEWRSGTNGKQQTKRLLMLYAGQVVLKFSHSLKQCLTGLLNK